MVLVKRMNACTEFVANDGCRVRELLHPNQDASTVPYSVAICTVEVAGRTYRHYLEQTEIYLLMSGQGRAHIDAEIIELGSGDLVVIPPQSVQWIENTGATPLVFAAIVSPPWSAEGDVRLPDAVTTAKVASE